jgi:hypothetical protein
VRPANTVECRMSESAGFNEQALHCLQHAQHAQHCFEAFCWLDARVAFGAGGAASKEW